MDRTFNYLYSNEGFTRGSHVLRFAPGNAPPGPVILQLCNYEITEYGPPNRYNMQEYDPSPSNNSSLYPYNQPHVYWCL